MARSSLYGTKRVRRTRRTTSPIQSQSSRRNIIKAQISRIGRPGSIKKV